MTSELLSLEERHDGFGIKSLSNERSTLWLFTIRSNGQLHLSDGVPETRTNFETLEGQMKIKIR